MVTTRRSGSSGPGDLPRRKSSQGNLKKARASAVAVPIPAAPIATASTSSEAKDSPGTVKKEEEPLDLEDELSDVPLPDVPWNRPVKFVADEEKRLRTIIDQQTNSMVPSSNRPRPKPKASRGWISTIVIAYLAFAYAFTCRTAGNSSEYAVCRGFDTATHYRSQVINSIKPYYEPYLHHAQSQADPYLAQLKPHYDRAQGYAQPVISRSQSLYYQQAHPRLMSGFQTGQTQLKPLLNQVEHHWNGIFTKHIKPYQNVGNNLYAANVEPRLRMLRKQSDRHVMPAYNTYRKRLDQSVPVVQRWYSKTAQPYLNRSYAMVRHVYFKSIHPRLVTFIRQTIEFLQTRLLPLLRRIHSLYIKPQIDRVTEKVFERRAQQASKDAIVQAEEHAIVEEEKKVDAAEQLDDVIEELRAEITEPEPQEATGINIGEGRKPIIEEEQKEAELNTVLNEKRRALEALRKSYLADIDSLGAKERTLLVERLNTLRTSAVRDIDYRFDVRLKDLKADGETYINRLERYFEKMGKKERKASTAEQVSDAEAIATKSRSKMQSRAELIADEIDEYKRTHGAKEESAVQKSGAALAKLVSTAQEEFGEGLTSLHDATEADWQLYHEFSKAEDRWYKEYQSLASDPSAIKKSARPIDKLNALQDRVDGVVELFEDHIDTSKTTGIKILRGESLGIVHEAGQKWEEAKLAAANAYDSAGDNARAVSKSIVVAAGGTPSPTNVQESASVYFAQATESAQSGYGEVSSTISSAISQATDTIESAYGNLHVPDASGISASLSSVSSDVSKALPDPSSISKSITSVYSAISSQAVHAASDALTDLPSQVSASAVSVASDVSSALDLSSVSSVLHEATRSASSLAGYNPSAEGVYESASSILSSVSSNAGSIPSSASSLLHEVTRSASSLVGATPAAEGAYQSASSVLANAQESGSSIISSLSSQIPSSQSASSILSSATREAKRAVGVSVSPEGVQEHVSSASSIVSEAMSSGTASVVSVVDEIRARVEL